jgi:hypothetical protein
MEGKKWEKRDSHRDAEKWGKGKIDHQKLREGRDPSSPAFYIIQNFIVNDWIIP